MQKQQLQKVQEPEKYAENEKDATTETAEIEKQKNRMMQN